MTTVIKSAHTTRVLLLSSYANGNTRLEFPAAGDGIIVPTADILAALDAVDANKVLQDASDALDARRELEVKLAAVTAERDAHAATIERVREFIGSIKYPEGSVFVHSFEDGHNLAKKQIKQGLRAALDPKPFVLPTEAGSGIEAERIDGPFKGETQELRLFSDGRWFNSTGHPAWPDDVMSEYTGHRLLDGDE